jgi:hypothetical protein
MEEQGRQGTTGAGRIHHRLAEVTMLGLVVALFAAASWQLISVPAPLVHDEAVYAVQGRALLDDSAPRTGVRGHRAPVLAVAGAAVQVVTDGERALRLVGLAAGVAALVAVWWAGRLVGGPVAGALAAAVMATVPGVLDASATFLTDLPAAAALLWCAGVLLFALAGRERAHPILVASAPLAAAAFYLRYGSALPIAVLFTSAGVLWFRALRRSAAVVGMTLAAGGVLLAPHLVNAVRDFGTPWGRVLYTAEAVGRYGREREAASAAAQYLEWFPGTLPGWPAAVLVAVGAAMLVVAMRRGVGGERARSLLFLAVAAVLILVLLGVGAHAEQRFTLLPVGLAVTAAAVAVAGGLPVGWRTAPALVVAAPLLLLLPLAPAVIDAHDELLARRDYTARNNEPIRRAGKWVAGRAPGHCVTLSSYDPQMTWYSTCSSYAWPNVTPSQIAHRGLAAPVYLVLLNNGKNEPGEHEWEAWLRRASAVLVEVPNLGGRLGPGEIRRWEPDALRASVRR